LSTSMMDSRTSDHCTLVFLYFLVLTAWQDPELDVLSEGCRLGWFQAGPFSRRSLAEPLNDSAVSLTLWQAGTLCRQLDVTLSESVHSREFLLGVCVRGPTQRVVQGSHTVI
jgi:hypothetical protein